MSNSINSPDFSDSEILEFVQRHYAVYGVLTELPSYVDLNRQLLTPDGSQYVVKIANCQHSFDEIDFENRAMLHLSGCDIGLNTPELLSNREQKLITTIRDRKGRHFLMRVITFLPGVLWAKADSTHLDYARSLGDNLARLGIALDSFEHPVSERYLDWDLKHGPLIVEKYRKHIEDIDNQVLITEVLINYQTVVIPNYPLLPTQVIHNDVNDYNLMTDPEKRCVSGIFDFGDMVKSYRVAEIAIASAYAIMKKEDPAEFLKQILVSYHHRSTLTLEELTVFLHMVKMRLAVSVCMSSYQYSLHPENEYLLISQKDAWDSLRQLDKIDPIAFTLQLENLLRETRNSENEGYQPLVDFRKKHLSENLSLAYREPLKIVRGQGVYLYDDKGNRYIDMVNNVCHLGHCHPKVVAAGQTQMALLNTNTRYLHDNIINFTRELLSTMPEKLSVCMFVNSGSEANELAIRLARTYTGNRAMIVVEGGYHGNSNACIDVSPYKFDGPGGDGAPNWVKQTPVPDPYRGRYRGRTESVGLLYAKEVAAAAQAFIDEGQALCGFICESIQGVGGQIVHPQGYLEAAYAAVRKMGGVCIADEVQVGMGRVGSHWWAFQTQDVVPDIITIGKPLGNGHPLAAVVTTQEIADAFVTGMEYFNTFGGNPVSCAVGSAVFQTIKHEKLMQHAEKVGACLLRGLKQLQSEFDIIGDVRGVGMFMGAEFVNDRETLEPASRQIEFVIERLKENGILLTTEGPHHNVLKIKPPLAFSRSDADYFLTTMKSILKLEQAKPR